MVNVYVIFTYDIIVGMRNCTTSMKYNRSLIIIKNIFFSTYKTQNITILNITWVKVAVE